MWGKAPRKIEARYETGDGKTKTSLLLASGKLATADQTLVGCCLCVSVPAHSVSPWSKPSASRAQDGQSAVRAQRLV